MRRALLPAYAVVNAFGAYVAALASAEARASGVTLANSQGLEPCQVLAGVACVLASLSIAVAVITVLTWRRR